MPRLSDRFLQFAPLLLVFEIAASGQSFPDYTNKTDILNGRRVLLQVDDIVLFGEAQRDSNYRDMGFNFYNSTNSSLSAAGQGPLTNTAVAPRGERARVVYGRWWESAVDMPALLFHEAQFSLTLVFDRRVNSPHGYAPNGSEADITCRIADDFTGDGFDDLLIGTTLPDGSAHLVLATASDTTKASEPKFGPALTVPPCMAMAKGDLNGDGQLELAYASATAAGGVQVTIYTFDPKTLAFTQAGSYALHTPEGTPSAPITKASITSGSFRGNTTRQLAIAYAPDETQTIIKTIDVENFQMKEVDRFETGSWPRVDGLIGLRAERLFGTQPNDFLVFFFAWHGNAGRPGAANKYLGAC